MSDGCSYSLVFIVKMMFGEPQPGDPPFRTSEEYKILWKQGE